MSEDKKDVVNDWIKFKLMEAVKKDPLYKDPKEDKAVMKDEETNVHDGISDLLLRVLSKDDIAKLNYINGFNPERDIHAEVIPNNKKEKIKESVELKEEDSDDNLFGDIEPTEDINSESNGENPEDKANLDATLDIEDKENSESEESKDDDSLEDDGEDIKNKGVGAFDRILNDCEKDEILSKAISALNASDIASARKEFYEWFDSFDDEHAGKENDGEEEGTSAEEPAASNEENQEVPESEEKSTEEENKAEEDKGEVDLDSLFA